QRPTAQVLPVDGLGNLLDPGLAGGEVHVQQLAGHAGWHRSIPPCEGGRSKPTLSEASGAVNPRPADQSELGAGSTFTFTLPRTSGPATEGWASSEHRESG